MDIRKYKLKLKRTGAPSEQVHFVIDEREVMAILTAAGKPVSIFLTDLAGEIWSISLLNAEIEVDMKLCVMELSVGIRH